MPAPHFEQPSLVAARLRHEWDKLDEETRVWSGSDEEADCYREIAEALRSALPNASITADLRVSLQALRATYGTLLHVSDREAVQVLAEHPIVREGLELRFAFDAVNGLSAVEDRVAKVLTVLDTRLYPAAVTEYVTRASRLFVWGFAPESVVMCGAALGAAYRARFPDLLMCSLRIVKWRGEFDVTQYEHAAFAMGCFTANERNLAIGIRSARNEIVHQRPAHQVNALDALRGTLRLLDRLFTGAERVGPTA